MRGLLRWIGIVLGAVLLLALLFALWVLFASWRVLSAAHEAAPERLPTPSAAMLADAARQASILGCSSCHGARLQGNKMFDGGPFATVWAPNLTELAARTSDQQLAAAIRQGIGHDGRALFVMPSAMYARMSDEEVAALIAHIRSLPRSGGVVPGISWGPIGRFALATGSLRSALDLREDFRVRQPWDLGPDHAAGRRLAANTCAECHGADLTGGQPTPEAIAPDLTIVGAYDLDQFRTLIRTGRPPGGRDLGLMREVSVENFRHLTDAEIAALHAYLKARAERLAR